MKAANTGRKVETFLCAQWNHRRTTGTTGKGAPYEEGRRWQREGKERVEWEEDGAGDDEPG